MKSRERFLAVMNFEPVESFPVMEFLGWWPETLRMWEEEGFPKEVDIFEHFDLVKMDSVPLNHGPIPAYEPEIFEETDSYIIHRDGAGIKTKMFKNSSAMPQYLDFPIKTRADFEEFVVRHDPNNPSRYPLGWDDLVKSYRNRKNPLMVAIAGPFSFARGHIGFENMMLMIYDDPQLIHDMMAFTTEYIMHVFVRVLNDVDVDMIYIGEDMAYKSGSMMSPAHVESFIVPHYRRMIEFFREFNREANIFLDSDGNIEKLLPIVLDCGFTGILPVERASGMEPERLRRQYPKLRMIGGLDKLAIARGSASMETEVRKASRLVKMGGYIPSFDHSVPPILSHEAYSEYLTKLQMHLNN